MDRIVSNLATTGYAIPTVRITSPSFKLDLSNLDSVRGLACFLLVAFHAVGNKSAAGMHLADSSAWHYAMTSLEYIRMPLFTTLSGLLYAGNRATPSGIATFLRKKARRLAVPMFFAAGVVWAIRSAVYGPEDTLVEALFFSYQQFWFVQAILVVFLGMALWDAFKRPTWVGLTLAAFAAVMIHNSVWLGSFFSFNQALYLLPFFIFGMMIRLWGKVLMRRESLTVAAGIAAVVLTGQQFGLMGIIDPMEGVPVALCGMSAALLLIRYMPISKALATIGKYSFTIYLWHSMFAATARTALMHFGQVPNAVLFVAMMIAGIGFPMLIEKVMSGRKLGVLFTGR